MTDCAAIKTKRFFFHRQLKVQGIAAAPAAAAVANRQYRYGTVLYVRCRSVEVAPPKFFFSRCGVVVIRPFVITDTIFRGGATVILEFRINSLKFFRIEL